MLVALFLALGAAVAAAGSTREAEASGQLAVVATTTIVGDIVAQIAGDAISPYVMLPPGADPHTFQASPRDARQVADADVVFTNGAGLEAGFLADLIAGSNSLHVVHLSDGLPLRRLGSHGTDTHGDVDPHVWMDPTLVAGWTEVIAETLATLDATRAADYRRRAAALATELELLDQWVRTETAALPAARRVLVTDHEVFGYFADRYGFVLIDSIIPAFSTAAEPSARHLAALRDAIVAHNVPAIFVGNVSTSGIGSAIARDLGIAVVPVSTGSLAVGGKDATSYQDYIRANVRTIVAALR